MTFIYPQSHLDGLVLKTDFIEQFTAALASSLVFIYNYYTKRDPPMLKIYNNQKI